VPRSISGPTAVPFDDLLTPPTATQIDREVQLTSNSVWLVRLPPACGEG
jgi:hypothetical protein